MTVGRVLRTSSFHLAATFAGVFCLSAGLLLALVYVTATRAMREQVMDSVRNVAADLVAQDRETGVLTVVDTIGDRVAVGDGDTGNVYLLETASGDRLAGNLAPMAPFKGWRELGPVADAPTSGGDLDAGTLVLGVALPDGSFLAVGQSTDPIEEVQEAILGVLIWGLVATVGLALVGGTVVSVRFLRRIDAVNRTARSIVGGNLDERVPSRGTGDEFDRLAANVNGMLDRIQSLMDRLRQVSNDIAHDLRTPLTRLQQRLERTRHESRTLADYRAATEAALAEADGLLKTFSALLRIAQIEAGTRRAGFAILDPAQTLEPVVEAYEAVAEEAGISLTASITPNLSVRGDRELLTQMFVNLVENAIRHTAVGTRIDVRIERRDGAVKLVVADDGVGIPEDEYRRVLERFVRLDRSRTSPGSGLGLALVAAVVELHGADLQLGDSRPGLSVTVTFPPAATTE
ncbi:MAG TPA: HAMP domain-containing sensor histidine kinase [Gammaproteobacteria bacterium]|nr:HAMP domain-containing sensor histidine kinase [Gammaproteobacteria bacterium]